MQNGDLGRDGVFGYSLSVLLLKMELFLALHNGLLCIGESASIGSLFSSVVVKLSTVVGLAWVGYRVVAMATPALA